MTESRFVVYSCICISKCWQEGANFHIIKNNFAFFFKLNSPMSLSTSSTNYFQLLYFGSCRPSALNPLWCLTCRWRCDAATETTINRAGMMENGHQLQPVALWCHRFTVYLSQLHRCNLQGCFLRFDLLVQGCQTCRPGARSGPSDDPIRPVRWFFKVWKWNLKPRLKHTKTKRTFKFPPAQDFLRLWRSNIHI